MKRSMFLAATALFITAAASAQQPVADSARWGTTVDSIRAKYKLQTMPEALTLEKTFPAIGTYQLSNAPENSMDVTIALDSVNKGIVWIDGLPEGRIKAYLRQSPATYRIVSQKTAEGKQISEGTLIYDKDANVLNVALGLYNDADPASVFAMQNTEADDNTAEVKIKTKDKKVKAKVTYYTAAKKMPVQTQPEQPMQQHEETHEPHPQQ